MNSFRLVYAFLAVRPGLSLLNLGLMALSVAMIVVALHLPNQAESRLQRDSAGIDLVLGAKGSPLQIVLASVYHLDVPPGNIRFADADEILADRRVKSGIPLALGDSYRGARIVGTVPELVAHYGAELAGGTLWGAPMQAVVGATIANQQALTLGAKFVGTHGLAEGGEAHGEHPYVVVGVLKPTGTVVDRLILTDLESVWKVHDHPHPLKNSTPAPQAGEPTAGAAKPHAKGANAPTHAHDHAHDHDHDHTGDGQSREITAMLIRYATPLAAASLPREINTRPGLVAASPAYETGRLMALVGGAAQMLALLATLLAVVAIFTIFLAINASFATRRYDLALLRMLGATPTRLFGLTLIEGVLLAGAGGILGLAVGHGLLAVIAVTIDQARQLAVTAWAWHPLEWAILAAIPLLGLLAAIIPAARAARTDVARTLSRG
jgi:putative ABC transport system permease protein